MADGTPSVAWSFHSATSYPPCPAPLAGVAWRSRPGPDIPLPPPGRLDVSLAVAIAGRASCRAFSGDSLTLEEVSTILDAAYGAHGRTAVGGFRFELRPVPSAGAGYSLELHLIVGSAAGLAAGTYRFVASRHALERTGGPVPPAAVGDLFLGQPYLARAGAVLVITAALRDALERYADRGYRYLLLEAGHVAQNVNLAGSALRIGTLDLGGFLDGQLVAALALDEQVPLYAVALGRPSTTDPQDVRRPATGQGRSPGRF